VSIRKALKPRVHEARVTELAETNHSLLFVAAEFREVGTKHLFHVEYRCVRLYFDTTVLAFASVVCLSEAVLIIFFFW